MEDKLWQRKLMAYLHDPPCSVLDIANREQLADALIKAEFPEAVGVDDDVKDAGRLAASIDSMPFPKEKAATNFDGKRGTTFRHPFMANDENWHELNELLPVEKYSAILREAVPPSQGGYKERLFLYWRLWREESAKQRRELAFFPADTRLPDHTIWTHLDITSALEGCRNPETKQIEPAFLIFQAGPVQSFVAAARSTRDLWSGSFLLSWLTGHAIKAITDECGPDAIISPSLRGNGIFDVLYKQELYDKITVQDQDGSLRSLWQRMYPDTQESAEILTNPTLPNRFFAVIPQWRAEELARKAEEGFRQELRNISEDCLARFCELVKKKGLSVENGWLERWRNQVSLHPDITWQCLPVDTTLEAILKDAKDIPSDLQAQIIERMMKFAQEQMPVDDRDQSLYTDASKNKLSSWGMGWGLNYTRTEHYHAARRNTRNFAPFVTDPNQAGAMKDALTAAEEIIGSEELWEKLRAPEDKNNKNNKDNINFFFNHNEKAYGAINIIKRLWCAGDDCYLFGRSGFTSGLLRKALKFDSVQDVADKNRRANSPYVAVIALDGDEMGKWMSGEKAPSLQYLLSGNAKDYFRKLPGEEIKRALTPAWHLQFSEALSNFANHLAGKVVSHYSGQLIYAGGDDVLAMVPADMALECACALRALFRGDAAFLQNCPNLPSAAPEDGLANGDSTFRKKVFAGCGLAIEKQGFVRCGQSELLVPGCDSDVSCGIAIAHYNHPLQHIVQEARNAESRAKHKHERGAMAVSLLKRSGEIIHWGAKWDSGAVALYNQYVAIRNLEDLEAHEAAGQRFPYALARLLAAYSLETGKFVPGFEAKDIICREFDHVLKQQMKNVKQDKIEELRKAAQAYLNNLVEAQKRRPEALADFANLFLTAAFIERNRED